MGLLMLYQNNKNKRNLKKFQFQNYSELQSITSLILVLVGFLLGCVSEKQNLATVIGKSKDAIGLITAYNCSDSVAGQGTGFFIAKNQLVTNKHVLKTACRADVKLPSGKTYPITFVTADSDSIDLVVVEVDSQETVFPFLISAKYLINEGEQIVVVGGPLGLEGTVSQGIVSSIRSFSSYGRIIQMTAAISPGSSGSPVMNMDGDVVGIATMYLKQGQNLNFAIPITVISQLRSLNRMPLSDWSFNARVEIHDMINRLVEEGRTYLYAEDYLNALTFFLKALELDQYSFSPHIYIPRCYYNLGRYADALNAYEYALQQRPDLDIGYEELVRLYLRFDNEPKAIELYHSLKFRSFRGTLYDLKTGEYIYSNKLLKEIQNWQRLHNRSLLR